MILMQLKQAVEAESGVSRRDLAKRFALSEDGVDAMMAVWIKKGVMSRFNDTNAAHRVTRVRYSVNRAQDLSVTVTM